MPELKTDIRYIKGIGEQRAKSLAKLDIFTLRDLISYFPRAYDDRRAARMIELLHAMGESGQQCLLFTCHTREGKLWESAFGAPALLRL